MTDHLLTDEACQKIIDNQYCSKYGPEMYQYFVEDYMRAAYDKGQSDMLRELASKYPRIFSFGQVLAAMRTQEDNS